MKNISLKVAGIFASIAFAVAAVPASAMTAAELGALLKSLGVSDSVIAAVVAAQGGSTTSTGSASCPTLTRDLTVGATGSDVIDLQTFLEAKGYLTIPAGTSKGYFGTLTQSAVAKMQTANGISPAAGYVGPVTKSKIAMLCGTTTGGTTGGSTTGGSSTTLGSGEASLEDFNAKGGDDDSISEGDSGEVAVFEFDVEDGDVQVERLDLTFTTDATTGEEDEPWNTFDTITLLADGKEIASEDVSDEDEWLEDTSPYTFRFSNLDYIVKEGEKAEITVQVETQNGIDGLTSSNDIAWTVYVAGSATDGDVRAVDGEGIDQYIGKTSDTVSFDISEEGSDDDLSVRTSSDDPDSTTLVVDDGARSDWFTVFAFDLDSDDESGDIEINDLPITFETNDVVDQVIDDLKLVIDGEEFDDYGAWSSSTAATASTTFDIDGDYVVEGGERVTVEVMARFKTASTTATYPQGTSIKGSVEGSQISAEGSDDVVVEGSATGDTHYLRSAGVNVEVVSTSNSDQAPSVDGSDNDVATFNVKVDITAFDQDVYVSKTGSTAFTFQVEDSNGTAVSAASTTATSTTVSSTADTSGDYYVVNEGDTETFTLQVTFNPAASIESQQFRLQILTINYNDAASAPDTTYTAAPASDFESEYKLIVD